MVSLDRRTFTRSICLTCTMLSGVLMATSANSLPCENHCDDNGAGCRGQNPFGSERNEIEQSASNYSGSSSVDSGMRRLTGTLGNILGISVRYKFYDDSSDPNALAWPKGEFKNGPAIITFGKELISRELSRASNGRVTLAVIAAHEIAHLAQFDVDCDLKDAVGGVHCKRIELHADYVAGFALFHYLSREFSGSQRSLPTVTRAWRELSGSSFNERQSHGSESERIECLGAGYEYGLRNRDSRIGTGVVLARAARFVNQFS